ncbi:hypothetical protein [Actinomadura fibrosa]|uniref:Pectate lyase superfamily protein domain-containing protein n=1 Tax=Actinomadura fibrosa TaxID=111802 RepID=A0ABW2Y577_9ACTN|nr:hypothetical protein [Actinomadura fibrosa]
MGGFPYTLPNAGGTPAKSDLDDLQARLRVHEATYGVPLDAFAGADDNAKLTAAMTYAAKQKLPPAILLSNRSHSFSGPRKFYDGFRLVGSLGTGEREFAGAGPQCIVNVGGAALFEVPASGVKNVWISGIQFRASKGGVHFQVPVGDLGGGPIINDATYQDVAWVGFATVMHARHLRVRIDRMYCNNGTDHQFKLAGSDNYYWQNGGYLSSRQLGAEKFYVWFSHMSRSQVGPLFITPEKATGVRIDGSNGGLVFTGTILDCAGRNKSTACQGAALLVTGGHGMVFDKMVFFNNAVNPAGAKRSPVDKGQVFVRGSASDLLFSGCQFPGFKAQRGFTPAATPAIYAASGTSNIKVVAPFAPLGGTRLLQQQKDKIISRYGADDWKLAVG